MSPQVEGEPHLHQGYKPYFIVVIPSQTYDSVPLKHHVTMACPEI